MEDDNVEETIFSIPELPSGKILKFYLLSPWDDPFFIGISGLEVFSSSGERIQSDNLKSNATEQNGSLESLLSFQTCPSTDPKRMWACNYRKNEDLPIWIKIELNKEETIAMIRVWNYSESRVHALRGVHQMKIELDETTIFDGELSCAFSDPLDEKSLGDTILFTTNPDILTAIAENDIFLKENEASETATELSFLNIESDSSPVPSPVSSLNDSTIMRPRTAATISRESNRIKDTPEVDEKVDEVHNGTDIEVETNIYRTKVFHMSLVSNWGHQDSIGLTGVQFLGKDGEPINLEGITIKLCSGDSEASSNLSNLISGRNLTCKPSEMWLTKLDPNDPPMLSFTFASEEALTGVSIWNYNVSPELSSAGVQCAQFYINGKAVVGAVLLRKAPGYVYFDYVQDVTFDRCHLFRPLTARPNTRSISAFIFQLRLLSTWGDEFYIGLNGIELYNRRNHRIQLRPQNIAAFPESVNILPSVEQDPRSSDKLIDGENDTRKAYHMWLTPVLPNRYSRVFIIFDCPTFVSRIRVFNYRKTPERGVRHISVSADDFIVYSGEVPMSTLEATGVLNCVTDKGTFLPVGTPPFIEDGVKYTCDPVDEPIDEPIDGPADEFVEGSGEEEISGECEDGKTEYNFAGFVVSCLTNMILGCVDSSGEIAVNKFFYLSNRSLKYCKIFGNGKKARIENKGCFNGSIHDNPSDETFHVPKYTIWTTESGMQYRCGDDGIKVYKCPLPDNKTIHTGSAWLDDQNILNVCR
ncbi:hypothetical protein FO519_002189 [Halicephalobus sp. NKZ332]|nr:hypothetical protein FO519_002189 [Halicephalobus sp. NKZ332]